MYTVYTLCMYTLYTLCTLYTHVYMVDCSLDALARAREEALPGRLHVWLNFHGSTRQLERKLSKEGHMYD